MKGTEFVEEPLDLTGADIKLPKCIYVSWGATHREHRSASIMASATPATSAPCHSTAAREASSLRGLRREAEGSHVAETVSEAHALPPRLSHRRREGRIPALGCGHIGGTAYCVWALPPNVGGTVHRHTSPTLLIPSPF
jgi:hypothetical protein